MNYIYCLVRQKMAALMGLSNVIDDFLGLLYYKVISLNLINDLLG